MTEYTPAKTGEHPRVIPQAIFPNFPKLQASSLPRWGERFAFVTEEEINLLVDIAVPLNTKKINFIRRKRF